MRRRLQSHSMAMRLGNVFAVIASFAVALSLSACGGGSRSGAEAGTSLSGDTIAQVGHYTITKEMLNEWITDLIGEEYYRVMSQPAPANLVADPPDYQACVASLRTVAPSAVTESELIGKCEALYLSMRKQVLKYLISALWQTNYAQAHGFAVSEVEAKGALEKYKRREYPNEADFDRFLATRRRTVSQELFLVKEDLLQQQLLDKVIRAGRRASAAFAAGMAASAYSVHCRAGYVVEHCLGYVKSSESSKAVPPSALLFEEIAQWRGKQ